ncbi:MAG: hypothetical protein ACRCVT_04525 [Leadbetterella sp.]
MKTLLTFFLLALAHIIIAQPGPATMEPANFIKDTIDRTVTMKNGIIKNTAVTSHWQLHYSGFQPTVSVGAGLQLIEPESNVLQVNGGMGGSFSMMAPIDLPHNSEIQKFEACYYDRSLTTLVPDCGLKFSFYRVLDDGCPPEVIANIQSVNSGNAADLCPIRCTPSIIPPPAQRLVNNNDYFYYVIVSSVDENGAVNGQQNCGNWIQANLGLRGVSAEFLRK